MPVLAGHALDQAGTVPAYQRYSTLCYPAALASILQEPTMTISRNQALVRRAGLRCAIGSGGVTTAGEQRLGHGLVTAVSVVRFAAE
ncbi:MAG: hypothetical protein NVSMB60_08910 [Mycobacterium sp.]